MPIKRKKLPEKKKRPDLREWIEPHVVSAIDSLEKKNFQAYIASLDNLGKLLHKNYQEHSSLLSNTARVNKHLKIKWLENNLQNLTVNCNDAGSLSFCIFEEAWIDDYLRKPIFLNNKQTYRRYLSPKGNLNRSTRKNINFAMRAIAICINAKKNPTFTASKKKMADLDKLACLAIKSYRTKKQKILDANGRAIAIGMTIVCSIMTAGAVAITVAAWPIAAAAAVVLAVFAASLVINWFSYRTIIPRMLNDIFGKDKFLEGWTTYRDRETGIRKQLSPAKRVALGIGGIVASILGTATGGVTYGFILGLGKLAIFPFLAAGTIGASCLPPLGAFISAVFCVSTIVLVMRPIINILKAKNFKAMLLQPFKYTAAIFDPNNKKNKWKSLAQLKVEKVITYGILGILSAVTLFGLVILQIQNGAALGRFLSQTLAISSAIAVGVAYTISMASVLIGQLPYALNTLAEGFVAMIAGYHNIFSRQNSLKKDNVKTSHPPLPVRIKQNVVGGIKETVEVISPNKAIEKKATQNRLEILNGLTHKKSSFKKMEPRQVESFIETKNQRDRVRYYKYYLFAQKTTENKEGVSLHPKPRTSCPTPY